MRLSQAFAAASLTASTMAWDVTLAGEQVDHSDVQGVADVLAVDRVEPLRDVRGLVVGLEDRLEVRLGDDALSLLLTGRRVEGLVVRLLDVLRRR